MYLSSNHKRLSLVSLVVFALLSLFIAVIPAVNIQHSVDPLSQAKDLSVSERNGLATYIAEGCVACHTQQVRGIEMDEIWGGRPSLPSDYYYSKQRLGFWRQTPSLLGSERTGPDLTDVGRRQPSDDWHYIHLYNPRIVVEESIMPAYPWLFKEVYRADSTDLILKVPQRFKRDSLKTVIATDKAKDLVTYLKSLKQIDPRFLYDDFIPSSKKETTNKDGLVETVFDGKALYKQFCASCHQTSGEGLAGAFPSLKGSSIVLDENPELMVRIILQGYDARTEYGVMPAFADILEDGEIAAIVNYEKNSWGNEATILKEEEVNRIRKFVNAINQ